MYLSEEFGLNFCSLCLQGNFTGTQSIIEFIDIIKIYDDILFILSVVDVSKCWKSFCVYEDFKMNEFKEFNKNKR